VNVRDLLASLADHAADGRRSGDEVLVRVGRELRSVEASYADGTFILIAGKPVTLR
jgi:hypothetical protein